MDLPVSNYSYLISFTFLLEPTIIECNATLKAPIITKDRRGLNHFYGSTFIPYHRISYERRIILSNEAVSIS